MDLTPLKPAAAGAKVPVVWYVVRANSTWVQAACDLVVAGPDYTFSIEGFRPVLDDEHGTRVLHKALLTLQELDRLRWAGWGGGRGGEGETAA